MVPDKDHVRFKELQEQFDESDLSGDHQRASALKEEKMKMARFDPIILHSLEEGATPYRFHTQMLADFLTIEFLAQYMKKELENLGVDPAAGL
jgi:hypothetical protein